MSWIFVSSVIHMHCYAMSFSLFGYSFLDLAFSPHLLLKYLLLSQKNFLFVVLLQFHIRLCILLSTLMFMVIRESI